MSKSTVLFLISGGKNTGAGAVAVQHARLLHEAGRRVLFCCRPGGTLQEIAVAVEIWHEHSLALPSKGRIWSYVFDVLRVKKIVRREAVETIFVYRSSEHLTAGLAAGGRVPLVRFLHQQLGPAGTFTNNWPSNPPLTVFKSSTLWLLNRSWTSHILMPDPVAMAVLEGLKAGGRAFRLLRENIGVEFVPGGVDTLHFNPDRGGVGVRNELGLKDEHVVVGLVARLKAERGHFLFLDAFARASREAPELRALLVGDGEMRDGIQQKTRELGVGDKVAIFNPGHRFEAALAALDIGFLCHPGSAGTGRAALEIMSMARPVVLYRHGVLGMLGGGGEGSALVAPGGPPDIPAAAALVPAEQNAGVFPPGGARDENIEAAFAAAFVCLARDPKLRQRIGAAGQRLVEERFSRRVLQRQLLTLCQRLAG